MVCPYCQHNDTSVINSRQHSVQPKIWRRRKCQRCKTTFTTYEQIAEKELPLVSISGTHQKFSLPRLMLSIYTYLPDTLPQRADDAHALATSVYQQLTKHASADLTREDIAKTTYTVLGRFHAHSGLSYAVAHKIITSNSLK